MTRYFEVLQSDGAARIGEMILKRKIQTPSIIDVSYFRDPENPIVDAGSLWNISPEDAAANVKDIRTSSGDDTLIILPHQAIPPAILHENSGIKGMIPEDSGAYGCLYRGWTSDNIDLYIMEAAGVFDNNAKKFFEKVVEIRNTIPFDTVLYAPAIALPENVAMLAYLGIDLMDSTKTILASYRDLYLTSEGMQHLDRLSEFPCRCSTCNGADISDIVSMEGPDRQEFLKQHNLNVLEAEMAYVRERIREETLREYIEGQCRARPWLTALLRLSDREYSYAESNTQIVRSVEMIANTSESLTRPEVVRFAGRVVDRYAPPLADVLVILPCSAKKPYSNSPSHQQFIRALGKYRKYVNELIITSPLGIVPRELEIAYPAAHYDISVTGQWSADELEWVSNRLYSYLCSNDYGTVVAHVDGPYRKICETVAQKLGINIIYTSNGNATSRESLSNLKGTVSSLLKNTAVTGIKKTEEMLRSIADFQFGKGAGQMLLPDGAVIKGPYPKHQIYVDKSQVATMVPQYGILALTLKGADLILPSNSYIVTIDDFIPRGSILSPGVIKADTRIRPMDEVIVQGPRVIGVGRALMGGKQMMQSTRGIAVDLRHVRKY